MSLCVFISIQNIGRSIPVNISLVTKVIKNWTFMHILFRNEYI